MIKSPRSLRTHALVWACAAALAACGGGDDDDSGSSNEQIAQAKKAFAHAFVGTLYVDVVAGVIYDNTLRTVFTLPGTSASGTVNCTGGGTLAYTYGDTDASSTVTLDDVITMTLTNCGLDNLQPLTGQARIDITSAGNAEPFYVGTAPGNLGFRLTLTNMAQAVVGSTLNGTYQLNLNRATTNGNLTSTVLVNSMAVASSGLTTTFRNFTASGVQTATTSSTTALTGSADTSIAGIGAVTYQLTLPSPITATGGQVRLQSTSQTLLMTLGATDAVNIVVDNGSNGSVDLDFNSSLTELSNLVFTP